MLENKSLNLLGDLQDEQDVLENFVMDYNTTTYVSDAINEAASSATPIYYNDIWENAADIREYIEDAISQGLAPVQAGSVDLHQIFQAGYHLYYTQSINENLDALIYNHIVDEINEYIDGNIDEEIDLDFEAIEERIEDESCDFHQNDQFSILDDIIQGVKDLIEEQVEEQQEEE
ncbi:hypothetical protein CPT_Mater230 [Bacillus phage Mater]|uniref:Uncharacterized protein n=1 Tax=Bacillus phage Mater TaxID=1540090 RepID=A0A0A0RN05_9CAUD|nr:ocr-like anti-restriction [Bacillus phage Mater]YP_009151189.1 ocr-like anti-restriction [Bacillus phage Mater]AIW03165.1 hypothetical protein CPT_Mater8 [Bacillus phage Mater]AIW03387.1 hypothetical protein CPT_Mater230 [Bacillus phage Mater]